MSTVLELLKLSLDCAFDGLVRIEENPTCNSLAEKRIIQETLKISKDIDFIFFRRFTKDDVRTSQAVAYIIDNSSGKLSNDMLGKLHHTLWLNGTVPLLYINNNTSVDILSCAAEPASKTASSWKYKPLEIILSNAENINEQINRFSANRLADGTFWDDERNKGYIDAKKSAHNVLLDKIKEADRDIDGQKKPVARRLLLLTLLIKYLEDRGVFNTEKNFFAKYAKDAETFLDVLTKGTVENVIKLLKELELKFNGDIFIVVRKKSEKITQLLINKIANIVRADTDADNQLYFWDIYNFKHIPVEVISHIYQYFTEKGKGAVFTPILLVNLMLDQVMPLENLKGNEKIFDPTCGSGIFLVSAFRRLVYSKCQNNKRWLTPNNLIDLLKNTIYGVELSREAAYITSFNLALAVCDALQPDIIWRELKFLKIIDRNIFIGDFGEKGDVALKVCKPNKGFDIILGNPPFLEKLPTVIANDINENYNDIPSKQLAYYVLIKCITKYLSEFGKICMIQPYGFLYNTLANTMRCNLFKKITVEKILDFISINGLFYDANTKAIALLAAKKEPEDGNIIKHLTFRRTISINEKICFELDHYDYHDVNQKDIVDENYKWKTNLLGGGRLIQLVSNLNEYDTIQAYLKHKRWIVREGFIIGEQEKKYSKKKDRVKNVLKLTSWMYGKSLLLPEALTSKGIDFNLLGKVKVRHFLRSREEEIYKAPLIIIAKKDTLESGFLKDSFLAYSHTFIGIKADLKEKFELEAFYKWFKSNNKILRSCLQLISGTTLTGRATATLKNDILNLPYPENGDFDLVPWEVELLDDIRNYMAEYVRLGQDSKLLKKEALDQDVDNYIQTFLRLMNKSYPNLKQCNEFKNKYLRLVAFSFSNNDNFLSKFDKSNWLESLSNLINNDKENLRTKRVIRILTGDILIIVKPNKLRYWIRSTAIRDVDDVINDIFKGKK